MAAGAAPLDGCPRHARDRVRVPNVAGQWQQEKAADEP
jgi:hypothetical protein